MSQMASPATPDFFLGHTPGSTFLKPEERPDDRLRLLGALSIGTRVRTAIHCTPRSVRSAQGQRFPLRWRNFRVGGYTQRDIRVTCKPSRGMDATSGPGGICLGLPCRIG